MPIWSFYSAHTTKSNNIIIKHSEPDKVKQFDAFGPVNTITNNNPRYYYSMVTHRSHSEESIKENKAPTKSPRSWETPPSTEEKKVDTDGGENDSGIELKPLVHHETDESEQFSDEEFGHRPHHESDSEDEERVTHRRSSGSHAVNTGAHAGATSAVGTASNAQVAVNIFISFVGAGLLGQPYAFLQSGWLMGAFAVCTVSTANVYAMLLLLKTRKKLEYDDDRNKGAIKGYGDIGRLVHGQRGERFVNVCLVLSQVGFSTAYIIFIAANVNNAFPSISRGWICFGCVPVLSILVQAKDMKMLSPFSLMADVAMLMGLGAVLFQDFEYYEYHHEVIHAFTNFRGLLYVASVAIYSMEGVNLVLPLETSCADRKAFPGLLMKVVGGITALMVAFGCAGYVAFGPSTEAPITLNLPDGLWSNFVKLSLCVALYLTYPIMMYPVNNVLEDAFEVFYNFSVPTRSIVVLITTIVAYAIPSFGKFLGLVGSSICMILGFILPCYFHLKTHDRSELSDVEFFLDWSLIIGGGIMGIMGTYFSFMELFEE